MFSVPSFWKEPFRLRFRDVTYACIRIAEKMKIFTFRVFIGFSLFRCTVYYPLLDKTSVEILRSQLKLDGAIAKLSH